MNDENLVAGGEHYGVGTMAGVSEAGVQLTSITSSTPATVDEVTVSSFEIETKARSSKTIQQPVATTASTAKATAATSDESIEEIKYGTGKPKRVIVRARLIHD